MDRLIKNKIKNVMKLKTSFNKNKKNNAFMPKKPLNKF